MTRGRKRRHDPSIPAHVDQAKIPRGLYWDGRWNGSWYVRDLDPVSGELKRRTVGNAKLRLSELHAIAEARSGQAARGTVDFVLKAFHDSTKFAELAASTRSHYEYCRSIVSEFPTKLGIPLGKAEVARLTTAGIQAIVERIAKDGHATKANHFLRYLRRALRWGKAHGACESNPAQGAEQVRERKLRRLPSQQTITKLIEFARERGARPSRTEGSCPDYLWAMLELGYRCRFRPIETLTLTDAQSTDAGILSARRKGSADNVTEWCPSLRAAWAAAIARRERIVARRKLPVPMRAEDRRIFLADNGEPLSKSGLDSAWQRFIALALEEKQLEPSERFGLHDLKRRGVTDTKGTRADKQLASGHRSPQMLNVYDHDVPTVKPAGIDP